MHRSHIRRLVAMTGTVAALGAGGAAVVSAHAAAAGCSVRYTVSSQWSGGFTADVSVTNLGDPVSSWALTWTFASGQQVTQAWNAAVSQSGASVRAVNAAWNGSLATGGGTTFGFSGSWNASNAVPVDFALNGVACTGAVAPSGTPPTTASRAPTPTPSTSPSSPAGALTQVGTPSRVRAVGSGVQYTWPGTYFEGRFRGTGVGIVLNDSLNDYVVWIDGTTVATLVTPGQTTYWVNNLANTEHTVRLAKRTESPWGAGEFDGLVAAPGGAILSKPVARTRQVEFIGDSWTAGYGNMSTSRDCSSTGVTHNSNADVSFGAQAAQGLNADYQIIAQSGMGMVRNYNGQGTDNLRTYYATDLQEVWNSAVWQNPGTWKPQVVVIGLGINDFSTPLNAGERWTSVAQLESDFQAAYLGFIATLRARYGSGTYLVLTYPNLSNTTALADSIQQIVRTANGQGDSRVRSLYYDNSALGLDLLGCDWHPSLHDDKILANALTQFITGLSPAW